MKYLELKNKWFVWPLFLFLLTYIILRAYFVEPFLDELTTFYFYIQRGKILGAEAILDANNHFVNSYFSRAAYLLFGDHFFGFRLLSIGSFVLYFFSTKKIVQQNIDKSVAWIVFLAMNMIPWISDYFSYSRGYGSALAFFFTSFCLLEKWQTDLKPKTYLLTILLFWLTIVSNLSMLVPIFLLFAYSLLQIGLKWSVLKSKILHLIAAAGFLFSLLQVYIYIEKLKSAGALWMGSRAGLWEVTGKSIAFNVLFNDHDNWQLVLSVILGIIVITFFLLWFQKKSFSFINEPIFWITGLLFLVLITTIVMACFLDVNYPLDRVGMYLVPLFILVLGLHFSRFAVIKWLLITLLWFPVSFIWKMNLHTSVFAPADRIQNSFYDKLNQELKPQDIVSADYATSPMYAYHERSKKTRRIAAELSEDSLTRGDYHISWTFSLDWPGYKCIYRDPVSGTRLYKRITKKPESHLILDTLIKNTQSNDGYVNLLKLDLTKHRNLRLIKTWTSGNVVIDKPSMEFNLFHIASKVEGENRILNSSRFDWYFGHQTKYSFDQPGPPLTLNSTDSELIVSLFNPDRRKVAISNARIRVYEVGMVR